MGKLCEKMLKMRRIPTKRRKRADIYCILPQLRKEDAQEMRNRYIPPDHLDRIMRKADTDDRIIYTLCIETGFRLDDILSIRQHQATSAISTGVLTLKEQKTRKTRNVILSSEALRAILRQLHDNTPVKHPLKYLFASRTARNGQKRQKLHRSTVQRHFTWAVRLAGLSGRGYTVHSLRKVYAHRLYDRTGSALAVMRDLNHDNIGTTMLYLADLTM